MTVDEFMTWSQTQPGRYELHDGEVVTMQAGREAHAIIKLSIVIALRGALRDQGNACRAIDGTTSFEPDALIDCGAPDPETLFAHKPVVIVEVTSPSTSRIDQTHKLVGYFSIPSVQHYLIVDAERHLVIHFRRNGDEIATRFLPPGRGEELLVLDPPGISVRPADFFADLPPLGDA